MCCKGEVFEAFTIPEWANSIKKQIDDERPSSSTWTQEAMDAADSASKGSGGWDEIDRFGMDMENLPF